MTLPTTLRFEDLGRPGERVIGGAVCFFEIVGKRAPKRGEWFASGAIPMAYKAKNDLVSEYIVVKPTFFAAPAGGFVPGEPVKLGA